MPSTCWGGATAVVHGEGFLPGDGVLIYALPPFPRPLPIPPSQPSGLINLAQTIVGPDGRFAVQVTFVDYQGRPFPGAVASEPRYYALEAYPLSLGAASAETSSRAPKAVCLVVEPGRLPATGAGPAGDDSPGRTAPVLAMALAGSITLAMYWLAGHCRKYS